MVCLARQTCIVTIIWWNPFYRPPNRRVRRIAERSSSLLDPIPPADPNLVGHQNEMLRSPSFIFCILQSNWRSRGYTVAHYTAHLDHLHACSWKEEKNRRRSRIAIYSIKTAQKTWSIIQQITFTNNPMLTEIILMEILTEEFKPIASEIYEFGSRRNESTSWTFWHVQSTSIPIWGTKL